MTKLDRDQQKRVRDYLQNLSNIYGVHILLVVCGWCTKVLGVKDGQGKHGISHGICPACAQKVKGEGKKEKIMNRLIILGLLLGALTGCASVATVARMDGFNSQWRGFEAVPGAPANREAIITVKIIVGDDIGYPNAAGSYSHPQGIIHIRGKLAPDGSVILCEAVIGHEIMHALQFQAGGFVNPDKLTELGY